MPMDFEKLKKEIEQAENKKSFLYAAYLFGRDTIRIRSSLYMDDIHCNNVESVSDIYNIVDRYQLDPQLFSTPFYIIVSFENYDENTIRIINQLDRNIHVQIAASNDIDKKGKVERKKKAIEETNQVLANQQRTIETAKTTVKTAIDMGCERKEEIANISTQITEFNCTNNESKKGKIEQNISSFQQRKGMPSCLSETKGQAYQLKRTNNNNNNNANNGFINVVILSLIVTFVVGIAVGIGYMLYKISIG